MIDENTVDTRTERVKQKMKNEKWGALCSVVIKTNK